ncbi:hypothetical protein CNMCM8980_007310 [Aspergillus fumigatiaffinis]|uniref:DUF3752 domain-containing protein n=1 Tax=Aspergillus fumigatiaffinis TaxID=340414 RepID=A0A8H4ECI3_9EURO|nr:hypothetical protein CNMCM5878_006026 [Aspergillus fumigatiaffinis]KAF4215595.1 hypothetical protein CNMCM6457_005855 [Aspergillus fumigatiaffinis]KAF4225753.1 hypothetical protein CNMCM6805_006299 [Aspergillus fumigatiaffinis]KAF4227460.1 hypothetical protein CNMCM8980_007310 [Aspergillus fumigatiaffinis]
MSSSMDYNTKRKSDDPGSDTETSPALKRRKVFGPVLPSSYDPEDTETEQGAESTRTDGLSQEDEDEDEDEEADDDYGPSLPPLGGEFTANPNEVKMDNESHIQSGKPDAHNNNSQRDIWMLRPPRPSELSTRLDPTRLKNRKFQGGQSLSYSGEEVDITWTETPQQKLKRLQDEAMGVSSQPVLSHDKSSTSMASKSPPRQHNSSKASERLPPSSTNSLMSSSNDDPSCRPFRWATDMASAPKLSTLQHQKQVGEALDFASKFTKGKYL